MNRLRANRAYLCGAMDRVKDGGVGWRNEIGAWLRTRGVIVLDPCNKPIDIGLEDAENRALRHDLKQAGDYAAVARDMKIIRCVDLRMVDLSDFLIVNLDMEVHACGTYEELFLANREKKPVIVRVEQGKNHAPDWLLGTIPHQMIFSTWDEVSDYLHDVDSAPEVDLMKRWMFFNYDVPQEALY